MRAVKEAVHELELDGVVVHLLQKVLDEVWVVVELVRADALHILLVVALLFEDEAAKVLGKHKGCIVARGQHTAIYELFCREDVAFFEFRGRATNI